MCVSNSATSPCGTGKRVRQITCQRKMNGQLRFPTAWCTAEIRRNLTQTGDSEETCVRDTHVIKWIPTEHWTRGMSLSDSSDNGIGSSDISQCSVTCNGGYEENTSIDVSSRSDDLMDNKWFTINYAMRLPRPQMRRSCNISAVRREIL